MPDPFCAVGVVATAVGVDGHCTAAVGTRLQIHENCFKNVLITAIFYKEDIFSFNVIALARVSTT